MWSAITKIFTKKENLKIKSKDSVNNLDIFNIGTKEITMEAQDSYDTRQSKQRASVKWLLSKAFNNRVPENLREPFYRDHEDQEHLKPQIVGTLANAELYCLALGNIYSDPNYHSLNHWSILQTLSRKGVPVTSPTDCHLTETVLIQTNPLRISAHMAVMESIMILYAKEVVTPDRVIAAIQRFSGSKSVPANQQLVTPTDHDVGLIMWVNYACSALRKKISQEVGSSNASEGDRPNAPELPVVRELKDLCDGVALAALVSFYCPDSLPWSRVQISYLPTVQESIHNLLLVSQFSQQYLPYPVFHMMPEDITYMRGAMKQNLVAFLADLFNVLEIHPAKCVRFSGMEQPMAIHPARNSQGVTHKRIMPPAPPAPIPDLRSGIDAPNTAFTGLSTVKGSPSLSHVRRPHTASPAPLDPDPEESFPIHRGRTVPTLSSIHNEEPLVPAKLRQAKEKSNHDSKADERGDGRNVPAGRPSNWEDSRRSSYAGRRSRRNSITDDSQLTIENFGGSQDQLNFIGRNPDKELVGGHVGRKISNTQEPKALHVEPNVAVRSSVQDARGSIQLSYDSPDSGNEKQDNEREKSYFGKLRRAQSIEAVSLKNILQCKDTDDTDGDLTKLSSFADIKKGGENKGLNLVYMQESNENSSPPEYSIKRANGNDGSSGDKRTSFATLPNTTTWQQQSSRHNQNNDAKEDEEASAPGVGMASQLNNIRLKLEEKRRHIESEKRRMEAVMSKQRQKVGKAAFLQAVTKSKSGIVRTPPESLEKTGPQRSPSAPNCSVVKPQRPFSLKEISDDAHSVEHKWLEQDGSAPFVETRRTPDLECMNLDQYHESIAKMNSSLHDIQSDIQRLASQQNQIQASQQQSQIMAQHHQLTALANQQSSITGYRHSDLLQLQGSILNSNLYKSQGNLHQLPHSLTSQHQIVNFGSQHNVNMQPPLMNYPSQLHQNFGSNPHINTYTQPLNIITSPRVTQEAPQFYLHEQQTPTQRRTWSQQASQPGPLDTRTYKSPVQNTGFVLHEATERYHPEHYQNGDHSLNNHNNFNQQVYNMHSSPQHRNSSVHRQISQIIGDGDAKSKSPINLQRLESAEKPRSPTAMHIPLASPPVDDMAPQSISFIGNDEDDVLNSGIGKLNITSGSRTYRIPSPTRPSLNRNSFHQPLIETPPVEVHSLEQEDNSNEKGFYISFDNEQPKRAKPPLRVKRSSPKKERGVSYTETILDQEQYLTSMDSKRDKIVQLEYELEREKERQQQQQNRYQEQHYQQQQQQQQLALSKEATYERVSMDPLANTVLSVNDFQDRNRRSENSQDRNPEAIIIGNDFASPNPDSVDEMEKKKEKIMLLSLQRRQQQEAAKARKEIEAMQKRERDKLKDEEKARKKEEQAQRRAVILEQYKLKKAIEEAEREGKVIDKSELMNAMKPQPKMRSKGATTGRPRPKTIHVDSGSVELAEGMLTPSRGKKGSSSNLTGLSNHSTMRRDYYRGSQDSLAGTHSYRESPDDCSGASPGRSTNPTLGRRGSYKTSRDDVNTPQTRGRPKYPTYQSNFKGRKSNSLMNLCDTDSGLGRATPPRRAPSPGMGPMRHLPSPSGPGSLPPGLMGKRRVFDDGSSDISSTPSSMMDYTGPRLYKQPATKSNRGIMLNAVEYCVFPGVVNKEAKRRVLEEIARSESKHFLILFRDAGCQFRALYSYCPDREDVIKLYGTGPKQVNDRMFDKFFKYNSGGKCFSQVHTKHLTVTIDAFTIHNSLWQGKKVNLPSKKDMTLVI